MTNIAFYNNFIFHRLSRLFSGNPTEPKKGHTRAINHSPYIIEQSLFNNIFFNILNIIKDMGRYFQKDYIVLRNDAKLIFLLSILSFFLTFFR